MTLVEEFLDAVEEGERLGSSKVNTEITRERLSSAEWESNVSELRMKKILV